MLELPTVPRHTVYRCRSHTSIHISSAATLTKVVSHDSVPGTVVSLVTAGVTQGAHRLADPRARGHPAVLTTDGNIHCNTQSAPSNAYCYPTHLPSTNFSL